MAKHRKNSWTDLFTGCLGSSFKVSEENSKQERSRRGSSRKHQGSSERVSYSNISGSSLSPEDLSLTLAGSNLHVFTLAELKIVTRNFSMSNFLGSGGFGPVYKGHIDAKMKPGLKSMYVAVKSLDLEGTQGHEEWLAEVIFLGQLRHPNLVKLIGYCWENEQRMIVYEYMDGGCLDNHLFKGVKVLPWATRLKIAIGAAKGLAFLHEAKKPVIYRDFKASNILLDKDNKAKLSDFGLAKDGPQGDESHISTRVMGTQGYAAPEYIMTGHLTAKSDVYSFGVVLLELLSGRRCVEKSRKNRETHLVDWAKPYLNKPHKLYRIMDPKLEGLYSTKGAEKAAAFAYKCLSHSPKHRPTMKNAVETLEPLLSLSDMPIMPFVFIVPQEEKDEKVENQVTKDSHLSYENRYKKHYPNSAVHSELVLHRDGHNLYKNSSLRRHNSQRKDQDRGV